MSFVDNLNANLGSFFKKKEVYNKSEKLISSVLSSTLESIVQEKDFNIRWGYILLLVTNFNSLRETIENCNGVSGYPVLFYSEKHNCLLKYCCALNSVVSPMCKNLFRLDFRDISGIDDINELLVFGCFSLIFLMFCLQVMWICSMNGRFPAFFVCVDTDDDLAKLKNEKNKKRVLYVLDALKKGEYNIKEKCGLNLMDEIGSSEEG